MAEIIIKVIGAGSDIWPAPQYVESVNVQLAGKSDEWLILTYDPVYAKRFKDMAEAFSLVGEVLESDPIRPWDGKPNRPMSAFWLEFSKAPPRRQP